MKKKAFIVLGLGYGDEGKGLTTDYLCASSVNPLVIRFNGGHQAGHNVVLSNGMNHIFSNFGSGTLRGAPTYWSKHCTFSPAYFIKEYHELSVEPIFFLDYMSPVTTHYDVLYNRAIEFTRGNSKHGSCGAGFGATIERHKNPSLQFLAKDLLREDLVKEKVAKIKLYYKQKTESETAFNFDEFDHESEDKKFKDYINQILDLKKAKVITYTDEKEIFSKTLWHTYIFEGAQGILLDLNFGIYPHVTKSNTTSQNAIKIIADNFNDRQLHTEIFYVTRAYQTRHGAGPFNNYGVEILLKHTETETNKYNLYQGELKVGHLNIDLLNYSLECDDKYSRNIEKNLVITCLDQLTTEKIGIWNNGILDYVEYDELSTLLNANFNKCKYSFSNCSDNLLNEHKQ